VKVGGSEGRKGEVRKGLEDLPGNYFRGRGKNVNSYDEGRNSGECGRGYGMISSW
jgi:hypothetical protein